MPGARSRPLRAVLLDAGNTLLRMDYDAIAEHLASRGIRVTPSEVERAEWRARVRLDAEVLARAAEASTESGATGGRYLRYLLEGVGVADEATLAAIAEWRRAYNVPVGLWTRAEPEAEAALALLGAAGLRAAVVSNSNGSVRDILEGLGLARYLEFVIDSSEVGVEKPSPRIFQLALERLGVAPAEVVYVGDLYSIDVRGARAVGMDAILLDPGACWGERDCLVAPDLLNAVRLILAGATGPAGPVSRGGSRRDSGGARRR